MKSTHVCSTGFFFVFVPGVVTRGTVICIMAKILMCVEFFFAGIVNPRWFDTSTLSVPKKTRFTV